MKILCALILLLLNISTVNGEIYQYQYSNGMVVYSDQVPNAAIMQGYREIQSQKKENITLSRPVPDVNEPKIISKDNTNASFSILTPEQNQIFRHIYSINVKFAIDEHRANTTINLFLDGKLHLACKATTLLALENLSSGTHTVYATLHDQDHHLLQTSAKITFHILNTTSAN